VCTLLVATRVWPDAPLLVAANRDERLGRPSQPPQLHQQGGVRFFAPRDLKSGGTWLGINAHGLFVAITNRFVGRAPSAPRSRGLLVLDALAEDSVAHAVRRIAAEDPKRHDPFHLVLADAHGAQLVWNDGERHRLEPLAPGIHTITERSLGAAPSGRIDLLHRRVRERFAPERPPITTWLELLREHADPGLEGVCVHAPERDYGTRSSTYVELGAPGGPHLLHADGPPCTTPFVDHSGELRRLLGGG
jgi:uncharacterized protein with NRDE domain